MQLIMWRDDQYLSFWDAKRGGGAKTIHVEDHIYKGHQRDAICNLCEVIIAATDMVEGQSLINCVVVEDNFALVDSFQLAGAHFEVYTG